MSAALERARDRGAERDGSEPVDAALEDAAFAALRAELDAPGEPALPELRPTARPVPWLWVGAAALAAAAALVVMLRPDAPDGPAREVWLGGVPGASATPRGAVERVEAFRWSPAPPPGSVHTVRVWLSDTAEGAPNFESPPRTTPEWIPTPDVLTALDGPFTWAVFERSPVTGATRRLFDVPVTVGPR